MGKNVRVWLAWPLCALALVLLGISVLIAYLGRPAPLLEESAPWYGYAIFAAGIAGAPILGALIVAHHPKNLYGWLWIGFGLTLALTSFGGNVAEYAVLSGNRTAAVAVAAVGSVAWVVWVALIPFLMLLFPDGRLLSPRWWFLVWTVVVAGAVCVVLGLFVPGQSGIASVENPFGVEGRAGVAVMALVVTGVFVIFGCTLLSMLSLVFRFRRAGGVERQQIKWFVYAAVLYGGSLVFSGFLGRDLPGVWDAAFEAITLSGLYVAVGVAIFRYRLYDIDLVINRTLVYGALTTCVVGIYVLIVGYLGTVFRVEDSLFVSLAGTGLVAVIFAPLREKLQRVVNRLMYGERDDPYAVISRLGERLEETLTPEAILPTIVETVREALQLPYAAIALERESNSEVVASAGKPVEKPQRLQLTYQNEPVGELLLAPRAGEQDFSPADWRLLGDLSRQAGVAVHAVRLTADLQRARERLVTTREEERRRLRRDLHDGVGPQLAALTLRLETARNRLAHDPETGELLADLSRRARSAVADIRRSVYALRPPALDELGLISALREAAAQYGPSISVEAPESLPVLPAAVEVATYRIAQEAMTNVVRHADARNCAVHISLDWETEVMQLEVVDNGRGIGKGSVAGVGLSSMRERAEELNGTFTVEALRGGGTRILAQLPCRTSEDTRRPEE